MLQLLVFLLSFSRLLFFLGLGRLFLRVPFALLTFAHDLLPFRFRLGSRSAVLLVPEVMKPFSL